MQPLHVGLHATIKSDFSHYPIQNAKFLPMTALLNRPTYFKSAKVSPPPCPQISWGPKTNEHADSKRASN